jgi:hypothetical protein
MPIKPTTVFICSARVHLLLIAHQNSSFPDARVDVTAVSFFLYSFFVFLNRGLKNQKLTMDNSKTQVIISQPFSVVMSPFSAHFFPFFKSAFKIDRTRYPAAKGNSRKHNPLFSQAGSKRTLIPEFISWMMMPLLMFLTFAAMSLRNKMKNI